MHNNNNNEYSRRLKMLCSPVPGRMVACVAFRMATERFSHGVLGSVKLSRECEVLRDIEHSAMVPNFVTVLRFFLETRKDSTYSTELH